MKLLKKLNEIKEGWKNLILNKEKPLQERRLSICSTCRLNNNGICDKRLTDKAVTTFVYNGEARQLGKEYKGCGCQLSAKASSPNSKCPLGKW